jgi:hypothetical protein
MSPSPAVDPILVDLFAQLRGGVLLTLKCDGGRSPRSSGTPSTPQPLTARISVTTTGLRPKPAPQTRASYHVTRPALYAYAVGEAVGTAQGRLTPDL